jgi:hypothetical protein
VVELRCLGMDKSMGEVMEKKEHKTKSGNRIIGKLTER